MAGIAPSVNSVVAPAVPAPTLASATSGPAAEPQLPPRESVPEGAGPALSAPKPVEVTSVPETPVDNRTPLGGTPRPELKLTDGNSQRATPQPSEAPAILGPADASSSAQSNQAKEPITDLHGPNGGSSSLGPTALGGKRKADDDATPAAAAATAAASAANGSGAGAPQATAPTQAPGPTSSHPEPQSEEHSNASEDRPVKKPKLMDQIKNKVADVKEKVGADTNGSATGKGKPGRPKKDKKAPPPVGKTERKTRSQGPAEASAVGNT